MNGMNPLLSVQYSRSVKATVVDPELVTDVQGENCRNGSQRS